MPTRTADLAGRPQRLPRWRKEDPRTRAHLTTDDLPLYPTSAGPPSVQVPHLPRWKKSRTLPPYRLCHQRRSRSPTSANARTSPFSRANDQSSASTGKSGGPPPLNDNAPPLEHQTIQLPAQPHHQHHVLPHSPSPKTPLNVQVLSQPPPRRTSAMAKEPCYSSPTRPKSRIPTSRCCSPRRRTS